MGFECTPLSTKKLYKMACSNKITQSLINSCRPVKGLQPICFWDYRTNLSMTFADNVITAIDTVVIGRIEVKKYGLNAGHEVVSLENQNNRFKHKFDTVINDNSVDIDIMDDIVVFVQENGSTAFKVYGAKNGLWKTSQSAMSNDNLGTIAIAFESREGLEEEYGVYYANIDVSIFPNDNDFDLVSGLEIETDSVISLKIDLDKILWIKNPDNTFTSTTSGELNTTWGGDDGAVSLYVPKNNDILKVGNGLQLTAQPTIAVLGDSISFYGLMSDYNGWGKQLVTPYANIINKTVGGNWLSIPAGGNDNTTTGSPASKSMCVRWNEIAGDPDIFMVMGGTNDGYANVGTMADLTTATPDKHTIVGAMRATIEGIRANYTSKIVWGIFPKVWAYSNNIDHTGVSNESGFAPMVEMMIKVLNYYKIPYFDLYNKSDIKIDKVRPNANLITPADESYWQDNTKIDTDGSEVTSNDFKTIAIAGSFGGKKFVSNIYCEVAFYQEGSYLTDSYQTTDGAYALKEYVAPEGADLIKISVVKTSQVPLYFTLSDNTYMCDVVHPTINAQQDMANLINGQLIKL